MTKEYWLDKWQRNDIKFNQDEVNIYLQKYYSKLNLTKSDCIFVPLCGKSIDMLWFLEQGHSIIAVELSPIACQAFFEENSLPYSIKTINSFKIYYNDAVTLYCGDFFDLVPSFFADIKAVYDRGGFVALPPLVRDQYANHLATLAPQNSTMIMTTIEYDQAQVDGPPYSASLDTIQQLYSPHYKIERLEHESYKVPEHLSKKGLKIADHAVYLMTRLFNDTDLEEKC